MSDGSSRSGAERRRDWLRLDGAAPQTSDAPAAGDTREAAPVHAAPEASAERAPASQPSAASESHPPPVNVGETTGKA